MIKWIVFAADITPDQKVGVESHLIDQINLYNIQRRTADQENREKAEEFMKDVQVTDINEFLDDKRLHDRYFSAVKETVCDKIVLPLRI